MGAILLGDATLAARIQRAMESCEDFSKFAQRSVDAGELVTYLRE
jgi:hypothetical protein